MKKKNTTMTEVEELLTEAQRWYWKDPEHARALQRAKYTRYPDKIKAMNKSWQEKNKEHFNTLIRFGNAIYAARKKGNFEKANLLCAAREAYKKSRKNAQIKEMS